MEKQGPIRPSWDSIGDADVQLDQMKKSSVLVRRGQIYYQLLQGLTLAARLMQLTDGRKIWPREKAMLKNADEINQTLLEQVLPSK